MVPFSICFYYFSRNKLGLGLVSLTNFEKVQQKQTKHKKIQWAQWNWHPVAENHIFLNRYISRCRVDINPRFFESSLIELGILTEILNPVA